MTKRLVVEDEASAELRDAARFYEHERAGLGVELVDTIEAVFDALANGTAFSVKVPGIPDELGIRRVLVSRFPYAVVHLEEADAVHVLAVAHLRRSRPIGSAACSACSAPPPLKKT